MTAPVEELGVFLRAGDDEIFTLLTLPQGQARKLGVILCQGGAWTPSYGRGRALRQLAHRLSARGFHVARFDYHGVGESSGEVRTFRLNEPFVDDLMAVVRWLADDHGIDRVVLMGTCFGARTALAAAPRIAGLAGVALFPPPVRDYVLGEQFASYPLSWYLRKLFKFRTFKRLFSGRFRKAYRRLVRKKLIHAGASTRRDPTAASSPSRRFLSSGFMKDLSGVLGRGVPVYVLYGDADADYGDFQMAQSGELGKAIAVARSIKVDVIAGHVHGLTSLENQSRVIERLESWLTDEINASA